MSETATNTRRWVWAVAAVTVLAALLRLHGLARYSLWYDESTTLYGLLFVDWKLTFLRADETRIIPLNSVILFLWHGLVSNWPGVAIGSARSDFLLRLLPLFFGVLTVPMTFVTARYMTRYAPAALAAALLVAVSPLQVYYAQELRPHTLYALLVLAAMYASFRALEEDRPAWWVGSVVLTALSFYAYYFSCFFMIAINLYVLCMLKVYRPRLKRWVLSQAALGVTIFPAFLMALFVFRTHRSAEEHWFPHPNLQTIGITIKNYFAGYSPTAPAYWPLFLIAIAAIAAGVFALRSRPRFAAYLVAMAFVPLLVQVAFWATQDFAFYTYRAQLAYAPAVYILAGAGLTMVRPRWVGGVALAAILVLSVPMLSDHYAQRLHPMMHHRLGARYKVGNRPAAEYIKAHWRQGDAVAHASTVTLGPFLYHYFREGDQAFVGFTDEEWQGHLKSYPDKKVWTNIGFIPRRIEALVGPSRRVWYVQSWWEPDDPFPLAHEMRSWLDAHGLQIDAREFDGLDLFLYDLDPALRARTAVGRAADFGTRESLYYVLSPEDARGEAANTWRAAFSDTFPPAPSTDGLALDVSFQFDVADGVPAYANGTYRYACRIANRGPLQRLIGVRVYEAAAVVRALSFDREPDANAWRPLHSHYGKVALRARLDDRATTARLEGEVALDAGRYAVYVQMFQDAGQTNERRGLLRVNALGRHGEGIAVGDAHGHVPGGAPGWRWRYLGEMQSDGSPVTLELIADNVDELPQAQVDIDRLMLVDVAQAGGRDPVPVNTVEAALAPFEEVVVEFDGKRPNTGKRQVYIEFFDAEYGVFRNLSFPVVP